MKEVSKQSRQMQIMKATMSNKSHKHQQHPHGVNVSLTTLKRVTAVPVAFVLVLVIVATWSTTPKTTPMMRQPTTTSRSTTTTTTTTTSSTLRQSDKTGPKKSTAVSSSSSSSVFVAPKPHPELFPFVDPRPAPYQKLLSVDPTFSLSPYEYRWSASFPPPQNPWWTRKIPAKKTTITTTNQVDPGNHVCFVHIGKTAGSTIGCALGFILHCGDATTPIQMLPGVLPQITTKLIHNQANDCADDMPYYLMVVRSPVARIQSAYPYDRPDFAQEGFAVEPQRLALYAQTCQFWTLKDLIQRGLKDNSGHDGDDDDDDDDNYSNGQAAAAASPVCRAMAYHAIRGNIWHGNHLYYNYKYYMDQINQGESGQVLVIRTEHLVDDYNDIETMMQQQVSSSMSWSSNGPQQQPHVATADDFRAKNVGVSKTAADTQPLGNEALQILCRALCQEIQVYKTILHRATNLEPAQIQESLQELYTTCPDQTYTNTCGNEYDSV